MSLDELFDEPTLEARLTGASTRLVALLDPTAPAELPTVEANPLAEDDAALGANVVNLPPVPSRQPRRTWLVLGAAAAAALLVGTVVAVKKNGNTNASDVALRRGADSVPDRDLAGGVAKGAAPNTTAAAAADTTVAAAAAETAAAARPSGPATTSVFATTAAPAAAETVPGANVDASRAAPPATEAAAAGGADRSVVAAPPEPATETPRRKASTGVLDEPPLPPATIIVNPAVPGAVRTIDDPHSTFSLDVDTGSYTRLRETVRNGLSPDPNEVRTEELLNYFKQDYSAPKDQAFAINIDGTAVPFLPDDTRVVRVGVQAKQVNDGERKDVSLTFVIDVSGSMAEGGKLDLVKSSLITMLNNLRPNDRIGIVAFSDTAWVVLDPTNASQRERITNAINTLQPTNSTNAEAGLRLGYQLARASYGEGRINRVILASDGVANVGPTGPDAISLEIREQAGKGIQLVTVGVGNGTYNDQMMEQLADRGDGFYVYIDGPQQAFKVFSERLTGTLQVVALDAKVQVSFDPNKVIAYRLLGYENRAVADSDFRNNRVDAAEFGAGHTATALYVVQLAPGANGDIGRTQLRWADPNSKKSKEIGVDISTQSFSSELTNARPRLQQDIYIAAWAEALRGGPWGGRADLSTLASRVPRLNELIPGDPDVVELVELIQRSAGLPPSPRPVFDPPPATIPPVTTLPW